MQSFLPIILFQAAIIKSFSFLPASRQRRFRFLDLCIRFGKMISKACPVGNLFSFGVCEGFNSGAKLYVATVLQKDGKIMV